MKKEIMFCGTASGVGKTLLAAGFCRLLARRGLKVAPFKAQNMSLNSIVTKNGEEISIAQALQAFAAFVEPDVRMNPILIKPDSGKSYIIRMGRFFKTVSYKEYYTYFDEHFKIAKQAFDSLKEEFDYVVLEGAGSPAEINLQQFDFVNMKMADYAGANVFVVGDIDRGGVFAHLKGTYDLIEDRYKHLVKGFIINKFRGDIELLKPAFDRFKEFVDVKIIGVVPYLDITLEDEDSLSLNQKSSGKIKLCIIRLPHMSNFSDFLAFNYLKDVSVCYINSPQQLEDCDAVIIPGSKNPLFDLEFLKKQKLVDAIVKLKGHLPIVGICGGFQLLGKTISNKRALGLLEMDTQFLDSKVLVRKRYETLEDFGCKVVEGYEIHHGVSYLSGAKNLLKDDGVCVFDEKNKIIGTYLHGFFSNSCVLKWFFSLIGKEVEDLDLFEQKNKQLDMLAETIEQCMDVEAIIG
ncbi:cobyric acid synthase [Hippea jasoniae]|uniref:cobyric acid synthase n=1 Tax=Hippea jasoniae TaxID=944479 RepID=UPI000552908D|nr:cobyric acid synthase [Hippea jasoniae]